MGKKFEFTKEQVLYVKEFWGKETPYSMKKKFGCSWYAIKKLAESLNLEEYESPRWSEEDLNTLMALANKMHYKEIATIMGKTPQAIYLKARKSGITLIQNSRKWTEIEEQYLKENWGVLPIEKIAQNLLRTSFSIRVKALRLSLGPIAKGDTAIAGLSEISEILNVPRDRITRTWQKLGLKIKKRKLTNDFFYYYVTWENLLDFLEHHQNIWDARYVEEYSLGIEPEWLKQKRRKDYLDPPKAYKPWTTAELQKIITLAKMGKRPEEIKNYVDRTPSAISSALYNLGFRFENPLYWKEEELKILEENNSAINPEELTLVLKRTPRAIEEKARAMGYGKKLTIKRDKR